MNYEHTVKNSFPLAYIEPDGKYGAVRSAPGGALLSEWYLDHERAWKEVFKWIWGKEACKDSLWSEWEIRNLTTKQRLQVLQDDSESTKRRLDKLLELLIEMEGWKS